MAGYFNERLVREVCQRCLVTADISVLSERALRDQVRIYICNELSIKL
jgi:hypothetical protein